MPSEQEIIDFLKKAQANEPDKFEQYIEFYKTKHPNFYKRSVEPLFNSKKEEIKPEKKEEKMPPVNPATELESDPTDLGSANVGEDLTKKEEKPAETQKTEKMPEEQKLAETPQQKEPEQVPVQQKPEQMKQELKEEKPVVSDPTMNEGTLKKNNNTLRNILIIAGVILTIAVIGVVVYFLLL